MKRAIVGVSMLAMLVGTGVYVQSAPVADGQVKLLSQYIQDRETELGALKVTVAQLKVNNADLTAEVKALKVAAEEKEAAKEPKKK